MKLHFVRHARAIKQPDDSHRVADGEANGGGGKTNRESFTRSGMSSSTWTTESLRPLSKVGLGQAHALADHFWDALPARIVSAPELRCRQTLEPLSHASGRRIEVDERLAETASLESLAELISELRDTPSVLCTHAGPIRRLLAFLGIEEKSEDREPPCRKGSIWSLQGVDGSTIQRARYLEPALDPKLQNALPQPEREIIWPQSLRAGVLDMGSTSFTLLVADVTRDGAIHPVVRSKVMLRLGTAIAKHGKLPAPLAREALEVAHAMRAIAKREKTEQFRAVATASLRDIRNGRKVGDKIARAIETPVDILDGETEARLMFRAFQERLSLGATPVLGIDLGGGSLEIAVGCGRHIDYECTLGLGVLRLHGEIASQDPMRRRDVRRIRERVVQELAPHRKALLKRGPRRLVVAGGTPRAIAQLVAARRGEPLQEDSLPMDVDSATLRKMSKRLVRSTHEQRLEMPGMRRRRADLVATGSLILESVADALEVDHFTFCDWGLREGVLLELMESSGPRVVEGS